MIKDNLIEVIHEMEEVTKMFKLEPFDIYIIIFFLKKKLKVFKEKYNV